MTINEFLDRHGLMMRKAGCPPGDIIEYWRYVIKQTRTVTNCGNTSSAISRVPSRTMLSSIGKWLLGQPDAACVERVKEQFPEEAPSTF